MISSVSTKLNSSKKLLNVVSYTTVANNASKTNNKSIYNILRRKRDRQGLVNVEAFENGETTVYPRTRQGLDSELNWALNGYSITPSNSAYRNPRLPLLLQHSNGVTDKNNVLISSKQESNNVINYFLDEAILSKNIKNNSKLLSIIDYKLILEEVKQKISDSDNIYVHDSAVGSCRDVESKIRFVTNDAVSSLFVKHLLPSTTPTQVEEFKHQLTVYCVPEYKFNDSTTTTFSTSMKEMLSKPFNVIDTKRGIAVIVGVQSTENIRNVISSISSNILMNTHQDALSLSADIYSSSTDASPLLIFNNDGFLLNKKFESGKVVSQGAIWSKNTLSRLYNSITYNFESIAQNQFDLIEKFVGSKKVNTTVPIKFETNSFKQPSSVVFIIKDNSGVIPAFSQLTAEQAEKYFVSGYAGDDVFQPFFIKEQNTTQNTQKAELFKNLIKDGGVNVYIINPSSFQKDAEVDKLLGSIMSGKVGKSTSSDVYSTLSPIQVPSTTQSKNAEEIKKLTKSFESKLQQQVESLLV
ncbi:hypothetical protein RB653_009511 [Dictyostelium firmibasis]|uniref:phosphoenolpyruvate carboxykinase (ATP) n=1 Tax=Dictyostelium firmibasis TaxID=79012 RepID=A0AAN7TUD0_9MYCE